ncbi:ribonuclease HI family protein [Massilia sp. IC2-476]|uniref:ribonuclease HI family protein n=1 Tax=Massilia sp. IC2-476 TaxID=2887199 RepID=UPI001D10F922|nr:ribonuclease HI family protein [Massilia sp. IC2-476]MCC2972565.1 ribonuclease HI family protein [Massilia sp. IC2-476]
MIDHAVLLAAAFKGELAASRKLAARTGMPEAEALHATLTLQAGAAGLAQLLAERAALRLRSEQGASARRAQAAASLARRSAPSGAPAWRAWFDGSARPNPGRCGIGAVLIGPDGLRVEVSRTAGYGNSSEAEYQALIAALEAAVAHGAEAPSFHGDSQVVVDDVNAPDSASAAALRPYRERARALLAQLPGATLRWIPRHKNTAADALSQRAVPPITEDTHERSEESSEP